MARSLSPHRPAHPRAIPARPGRFRTAALSLTACLLVAGLVAAATPAGAAKKKMKSGPVVVLSAGSLSTLMKTYIGPGFHRATGYTVTDISHGSTGLAQDIKTGVYQADVFWSATPSADQAIEGAANGNWVTWYVTFAESPLVLGYDRSSAFAATIKKGPWWKVVTATGFLLGRTNPVTDPKGRLAVAALKAAAKAHHDPAVAALATKTTNVYTETTLVGRLQAGQLDAGFFYAVEASASDIPTVPLTGTSEHATYTLSVVSKAPHPAAADAFVAYLLTPAAKKLLAKVGLREITPKLSGSKSAVPKSLRKVLK